MAESDSVGRLALPITIKEQHPGTNTINIASHTLESGNGIIEVDGTGNIIVVEQALTCYHLYINVKGDSRVQIGPDCILNGVNVYMMVPGVLEIGTHVGFNGHSNITMHEEARIRLGDGCLIAAGCSFSSSHVHKIMDLKTMERLNPPGDVIVEERVWCAGNVNLWGNTYIGKDSVVGAGTSVSKQRFPPNSLIVGNPARVAREGITWEK